MNQDEIMEQSDQNHLSSALPEISKACFIDINSRGQRKGFRYGGRTEPTPGSRGSWLTPVPLAHGSSRMTCEETDRHSKRMELASTCNRTPLLSVCTHICLFPVFYKELRHTGLAQALGPEDTSMEAEEQGHEVILLISMDDFNLSVNDVPEANLSIPS